MLYRCGQRRCALGGDRVTGEVEADELFPGGPESGAPGKVRFAGSVELDGVGLDQARFGIVPNGSAGSLCAFPHANVGPGSMIVAEGWHAYPATTHQGAATSTSSSGLAVHKVLPRVRLVFSFVER